MRSRQDSLAKITKENLSPDWPVPVFWSGTSCITQVEITKQVLSFSQSTITNQYFAKHVPLRVRDDDSSDHSESFVGRFLTPHPQKQILRSRTN